MFGRLSDFYLNNLSNNRIERIWKLAQIDFKKRYYNDKLGIFWALLNPLLQVLLYATVFEYVLDRSQEHFALFLFIGLIFWGTFAIGTNQALQIFKVKRYLIENIQLNKIDLFYSHCISNLMSFSFNFMAYLLFSLLYGIEMHIFYAISIVLLQIAIAFSFLFGVSLIVATLSIQLKDINHIWSIALLTGFWTAGIFFPADLILSKCSFAHYINPFIGILDNCRSVLIYNKSVNVEFVIVNITQAVVVVSAGLFFFNNFSDKAIEKL